MTTHEQPFFNSLLQSMEAGRQLPKKIRKWLAAESPKDPSLFYIRVTFALPNDKTAVFQGYVHTSDYMLETGNIYVPYVANEGVDSGVIGLREMITENRKAARSLLDIPSNQSIDESALFEILGTQTNRKYGRFMCLKSATPITTELKFWRNTPILTEPWREVSHEGPYNGHKYLLSMLGIVRNC